MLNLATVTKTEIAGGFCLAVCEIMGDSEDSAKDDVLTLPGFKSRPLAGQKILCIESPSGDKFFFGIPLETADDIGATRVYWTDASGSEKGHILGKPDGTLEIITTGALTMQAQSILVKAASFALQSATIAIEGVSGAPAAITSKGTVTHTGAVTITGAATIIGAFIAASLQSQATIQAAGNITSTGGDVIAGSISLKNHTHPVTGITVGSGSVNTGSPA